MYQKHVRSNIVYALFADYGNIDLIEFSNQSQPYYFDTTFHLNLI